MGNFDLFIYQEKKKVQAYKSLCPPTYLHVPQCHGERIHKCEKCDYVAKSKYRLKDHVDKVHAEKEMFACHICDYKTKYKCSLKPHIDNVHLQLNEKCPTCGKEFRRTEINSHIKIKHSTEDKRFHCPKCELKFHRQCDVNSHIKRRHTKKELNFECKTCHYRTETNSKLQRHIGTVHTKTISFPCTFCNLKYHFKGDLKRHCAAKHRDEKIEI